jgi:predicted negative regulator of RcsB-dependent stress response
MIDVALVATALLAFAAGYGWRAYQTRIRRREGLFR